MWGLILHSSVVLPHTHTHTLSGSCCQRCVYRGHEAMCVVLPVLTRIPVATAVNIHVLLWKHPAVRTHSDFRGFDSWRRLVAYYFIVFYQSCDSRWV